jgi:putative DNA-binding protein
LLNPNRAHPKELIDPFGRQAGKRFDVYRNNVVASLIDAMQIAFPVINKLIGDVFFKTMAGIYVRKHPPSSPLLMFYGESFPAFLEGFKHVAHLPYLADVARLELARRRCYHAADTVPIEADLLAEIAPEVLMTSTFTLSPALELLSSRYPIFTIWNVNMIEDAPKPEASGEFVLLTRPELDVEMQKIDLATHMFMSTLKTQNLEQAYDAATRVSKDFDLSNAFNLLLKGKIITKVAATGENNGIHTRQP